MGVDIAQAALAAGHAVVATGGRDADRVSAAIGAHDDLLVIALDITDDQAAYAAVDTAVARFGGIDVLVNNAGNFYAGFFEVVSPAQLRAQMETNFFGPINVTRAVLPVMRRQRSGRVVTVSSLAGLVGQEFCAAYAASKFALEGWMESLQFDVEPYGIGTMIVEPGFFRTELLVEGASSVWPELSIDDYDARTGETVEAWKSMNGAQGGGSGETCRGTCGTCRFAATPPRRWVAGADAVSVVEQKAHQLLDQVEAHRGLSSSLAHVDVTT